MRKIKFSFFAAALACALSLFMFSGCGLLNNSNSIYMIREKVETLRYETSDKIIDLFIKSDAEGITAMFCSKTQALPDVAEQVTKTLTFMEGDVSEYNISKTTGYEGYANDGPKVTEYSFSSEVYITTDTGRKYVLSLNFNYIAADDSIEGLTSYNLSEYDREGEDRKICRAGYGWVTPYDPEFGVLTAGIVKAVGSGDAAALKKLLCAKTQAITNIDAQISAVFEYFDGTPTFTERADGLYNYSYAEEDFTCRAIGYEEKGETAWVSFLAQPVCTDKGKKYQLRFVAYLKNTDDSKRGVSWLSFEDWQTKEEVQLGEWLHD